MPLGWETEERWGDPRRAEEARQSRLATLTIGIGSEHAGYSSYSFLRRSSQEWPSRRPSRVESLHLCTRRLFPKPSRGSVATCRVPGEWDHLTAGVTSGFRQV